MTNPHPAARLTEAERRAAGAQARGFLADEAEFKWTTPAHQMAHALLSALDDIVALCRERDAVLRAVHTHAGSDQRPIEQCPREMCVRVCKAKENSNV